ADRDHAGERPAVGGGGRALRRPHSRRAGDRRSRRQLPHRRGRAGAVRRLRAALHRRGLAAPRIRAGGRVRTRRALIAGACGGLAAALAAGAGAGYPARPGGMGGPFLPGGGADLIARLISPHLQQRLGQPFVVETRAGAAGRIGTAVVAKSDADGHVLLMTTESSLVIAPHIGVPLNYEPLADFAPVSLLARNVVILVVHPSVPARTLADYIALARAQPGQLFYASSGVGGPNHLAGEIFKRMTGLDIVHVPFPGTGGAIQAVIGNQVG